MYDVKVTLRNKGKCPYTKAEESFEIKGTKLYHPEGQGLCIYTLASIMPLITLWQSDPENNDHDVINMLEGMCPHNQVSFKAERTKHISNK